jgi:Uma2 family endonuclease
MGKSPAQAGGELKFDMVNLDMVEPATEPKLLEPTPHRFTVDEYYRMADTGILHPDARVELLDGEIIDMAPIGPFHGGTVNSLIRLLAEPAKGRWLVVVQNPVRLGPRSEPQPDFLLVKPVDDDYQSRHPVPEDVFLLIEVAESSLKYDRNRKIPAYSRAGIREVWIINLLEKTIEVYRDPHPMRYASVQTFGIDDTIEVQAFPDVRIKVGALLKRAN